MTPKIELTPAQQRAIAASIARDGIDLFLADEMHGIMDLDDDFVEECPQEAADRLWAAIAFAANCREELDECMFAAADEAGWEHDRNGWYETRFCVLHWLGKINAMARESLESWAQMYDLSVSFPPLPSFDCSSGDSDLWSRYNLSRNY